VSARQTFRSDRNEIELFRALPEELAPRHAQDLTAYPFFGLSQSRRVMPIDLRMGQITIRVEAAPDHGMATIWDADVLVSAARKYGSHEPGGWGFEVAYLHLKSGRPSPLKLFAFDLWNIVRRQPLAGYRLAIERRRFAIRCLAKLPLRRRQLDFCLAPVTANRTLPWRKLSRCLRSDRGGTP
jgi:plasmid replication initiation protein